MSEWKRYRSRDSVEARPLVVGEPLDGFKTFKAQLFNADLEKCLAVRSIDDPEDKWLYPVDAFNVKFEEVV